MARRAGVGQTGCIQPRRIGASIAEGVVQIRFGIPQEGTYDAELKGVSAMNLCDIVVDIVDGTLEVGRPRNALINTPEIVPGFCRVTDESVALADVPIAKIIDQWGVSAAE